MPRRKKSRKTQTGSKPTDAVAADMLQKRMQQAMQAREKAISAAEAAYRDAIAAAADKRQKAIEAALRQYQQDMEAAIAEQEKLFADVAGTQA